MTPRPDDLLLAEQLLLLVVSEDRGGLVPLAPEALSYALAGSVLLDLSARSRIDTDTEGLALIDASPLDDPLLDPLLAEIAMEPSTLSTRYWLDRFRERSDKIRTDALARLTLRGILRSRDDGFIELTDRAAVAQVQLRVIGALRRDDIPDTGDVMLIGLLVDSGILLVILPHTDLEAVRPRIDLLRRTELIGRAVSNVIWEREPPQHRKPPKPSRPIPRVRGLPWIGSGIAMARDLPGFLVSNYRRHGPVFRIRLPGRRLVVLAGPEANRFAGVEGRDHFRAYATWQGFAAELGADRALPGTDGADHFHLRRAQSKGYSRRALRSQLQTAIDITRREVDSWGSEPRPALHALQCIVSDQLGTIVSGTSSRGYIDDLNLLFRRLLQVHVTRQLPRAALRTPAVRRARRRVLELGERMRSAHEERPPATNRDLVDDLLSLHESDPQLLPDTDLPVAILGPLIAGLDTVAGTCAFMLYSLLDNPDVMRRMTDEADSLFRSGAVTEDGVRALDVTHRVALETLRLYPVAPALMRRASNAFEFRDHVVPAGSDVLLAITVTHHLEECFPDPGAFDIERYAKPRMEHRQQDAYVPFGLGPHRCLGSAFAEWQIAITMATILHAVELERVPANYRLRVRYSPTTRVSDDFRVRVKRRRV